MSIDHGRWQRRLRSQMAWRQVRCCSAAQRSAVLRNPVKSLIQPWQGARPWSHLARHDLKRRMEGGPRARSACACSGVVYGHLKPLCI